MEPVMLKSHGRWDYVPITRPSSARWPNGSGLAVYVALGVEEYVFGGNPRAFESPPQPTASLVNISGTDYLAITFNRRHNAIDTAYVVEYSGSLDGWTPVNLPVGTPTDLGNGLERVTYRDLAPFDQGPRYLRVRAVR
jgi:hypothetical protein